MNAENIALKQEVKALKAQLAKERQERIQATSAAQVENNGATEVEQQDVAVIMYTVKQGDTLSKIAKAHGCSVAEIQRLNGLNGTMIRINQKLKIPDNR